MGRRDREDEALKAIFRAQLANIAAEHLEEYVDTYLSLIALSDEEKAAIRAKLAQSGQEELRHPDPNLPPMSVFRPEDLIGKVVAVDRLGARLRIKE